jgi:hypothetical protein
MKTPPLKLKQILMMLAAMMVLLGATPKVQAATTYTFTGTTSGAWNVNNNWSPSTGFPVAGDTAIIPTGKSCTGLGGANQACTILTIQGSGTLTVDANTLTVSGNATVGSSGGTGATLTIASGGTFSVGGTYGYNGTTPVINNNGTFSCAGGAAFSTGAFNNNGLATFTGSAQEFNGTYTFTQGANATLDLSGNSSSTPFGGTPTTSFSASGNTVIYAGGANMRGGTYYNVTVTGNSSSAGASTTVNGTLTIKLNSGQQVNSANNITMGNNSIIIRTLGALSGTPTFPASPNYVNLIYNNTAAMTTGSELPANVKNLTLINTYSATSANKVSLNSSVTVNGTFAVTYPTSPNGASDATVLAAASGKTLTFSSSPVTINLPGSTITGGGSPYAVVSGGSTFVSGTLGTLTVQGAGAPASSSVVVAGGQLLLGVGPTIFGAVTTTVFTTTYGTASGSQSYSVSGANLTADLVATAGTGFEVATSSGGIYGSSVSFTQTGGSAGGTVFVRLAASAPVSGTYNSANAIVLSSTGANNANITTPSSGNAVSKHALTVTASAVNKTYGQALTGGSGSTAFTSSGLQNSETIGSVTIAYGTGSAANAAVGTYSSSAVVPSAATGGTFAAGNYTVNYANGNIIVGKANLTVTANNANKAYGQSLTGGSGSTAFTSSGLQNSETIGSVTIAYGTGSAGTAAVNSSPYAGSVTPSAATGGSFNVNNYIITYNTGSIIVGAANLSVTANNVNKTYGQALTGGTGSMAFTSSGLQNSETIGSVTIAYGTGSAATDMVAGSPYTGSVTPSVATGGTFTTSNYNITYNSGNIIVGNATATVVVTPYSVTYDGNAHTASAGTITGVNGETGATVGTVDVSGTTHTVAGTYSSDSWTLSGGANYNNIGATTITDTINQATPSFSGLSSVTNSYGVTNITLNGTLSASGPVYPASGETVSATINGFSVNGTIIDGTGDFSITYNDPSLATNDVAGSPYTITYNYAGNANLAIVTDTSTSLAITNAPLSITANDDSKCYGDTRSYGAGSTAFNSIGLLNGETIGTVTITASDSPSGTEATDPAGNYNLTPSAAMGGTFDADNYLITYNNGNLTVNPLPTTPAITGPNSVAPLSTATYSVVNTEGSTYNWTVPADASFTGGTGNSINVTFGSTSGNVSVSEINSSGCTGTPQSEYVTVNSCTAPTIVGGIDPGTSTLCAGSPLILTLTNATGAAPMFYQWQTNGVDILDATNVSYTNLSVTLADMTNYVCIVSNSCGSVTSEVATVIINPLPTVGVNSTTICAGDSATLTATTGASNPSYLWSDPDNSTTASITVSPASTTTYTVTVTDGVTGCANSGSGTVTVNPLPTVSVNSETICAGDPATLTATTSANSPTYLWNDPANSTTASITLSPSSTTTYTVTVTDGVTGCANSGSGTVTVNPLPTASVNSETICAGGSATLMATTSASSATYLWSPGEATTASITVSPTSTTIYTVTVTDGVTGCANSGSGMVTVNSAVANDVTYNATIGYTFMVAETNLLGHASGSGGVTLTTVQSPSANGATVTNSGGQIFYLANVTNTDTFTYTVASVTGGCTATGTVTLNPIHPIGSAKMGIPTNGVVTIQFFGIPGTNYLVETATNVIFTPYWPLSTNSAGSDGSWQFTDTHATNQQQFYRSTLQP